MNALSYCGPLNWELTTQDFEPLNQNIFTVEVSSIPRSLGIYSNNINDEDVYIIQVTVKYLNFPTVSDSTTFKVSIEVAKPFENKAPIFEEDIP